VSLGRALGERPQLAALLGALCIAFSGIFYRLAAATPASAAVFRCLYGLPLLAVIAWWEHRRYGGLPRRTVALGLIAGVFFAIDLLSWHHAVDVVGAGLSTVLANQQVLIVGLAAWLIFGERPSRAVALAVPVVLVGVVLISGLFDDGAYGENPALGVVLCLVTALAYAGYLIVIRHGSRDERRIAGPLVVSTFATMVVAGLAGVPLGELDLAPSWPSHGWLMLYGLTSQSLGYLLISVSLPRLPAVVTSIILLAQPVATMVLSIVLLRESPSALQLVGVALVVGGIAVATVPIDRLRGPRPAPAPT
jgi:drug/metabolite transporter (DMT)-like permease